MTTSILEQNKSDWASDTVPILRMHGIRKLYDSGPVSVEAIRGIDLTVQAGEYVAIIGPSGSGKSTLMHMLGCLDTPTAGTYSLAGIDVWAMDETALAAVRHERIGFVFQQFHLLPTLSAWRNVESGGQQQRVAVARALVTEPALILADEPTGNLDSKSTADVLGLLADLHASGRTIVLITHDAEVAAAAQRTVRIADGVITTDQLNENFHYPRDVA
jgi:putative ABC transport system ATP-binding protein